MRINPLVTTNNTNYTNYEEECGHLGIEFLDEVDNAINRILRGITLEEKITIHNKNGE